MSGKRRRRSRTGLRFAMLTWMFSTSAVTLTLLPAHDAVAAGFSVTPMSSGSVTASDLAAALAGSGVTISNATVTGSADGIGSFSGGTDVIGIDSGVALSTGFLGTPNETCTSNSLLGPNDVSNASCSNDTPGDADLDALVPTATLTADAAVIEFDVVPETSKLVFNYVFGSEEYNEFVNTDFNDVFGLFVNGQNCAVVPGTSTPVAVNNVNGGNPIGTGASNSEFFRDNDPADFSGSAPYDTQLDGLTTQLECSASVEPGTTNHVKLGIQDVGDTSYDSVVLIKAGSFVSGGADTAMNVSLDNAVETVQYSDPVDVTAHLSSGTDPVVGQSVTLTMGSDVETAATDANGDAHATLRALVDPGERSISASFAGTPAYLSSQGATSIQVLTEDCVLTYAGDTTHTVGTPTPVAAQFGEPTEDLSVGSLTGHTVSFDAVDQDANHVAGTADTDSTGLAATTLSLPLGNWQVSAVFDGDTDYSSCDSNPADVSVIAPVPSFLQLDAPGSVQYSDPLGVSATLFADGAIPGEPVTFSLGGATTTAVTNGLGAVGATLPVVVPSGTGTVEATFAAADGYLGSADSAPVTVTPEDCTLTYNGATDGVEGDGVVLAAGMGELDASLGDRSGKTVSFSLDDGVTQQTVNAVTDGTGLAQTSAPLGAGTWQVTPAFAGDSYYSACAGSAATIDVVPLATGPTATAATIGSVPDSVQYSDPFTASFRLVTVGTAPAPSAADSSTARRAARPAVAGVGLGGARVVVTLGSASATATTDSSGSATVTLPVKDPSGTEKLRIHFAGDSNYAGSTDTRSIDVTREDTTIAYTGPASVTAGKPVTLSARLAELDSSVGDLSGRTIHFAVTRGSHSRSLAAVTNGSGRASATMTPDAGSWSVRPAFNGDKWYRGVTAAASVLSVVPQVGSFGPQHHNPAPPPPSSPTPGTTPAPSAGSGSGTVAGGNHDGSHVLGRKVTRSPTPAPEPGGESASGTGEEPASGAGEGSGETKPEFNQPAFVLSIPDVHQISLGSTAILVNGLLALLMVMLIAFPAELFNGTLKENYEEVRGWFGPITRLLHRLESGPLTNSIFGRALGGVVFVMATGVVYAFVEPGFGLHRESLQLVLALTLGLVVITLLANESALLFGRLRYGERGRLRLRPGALLVALGCVLLSRAAHFEPGYVYGLVAGFTFSRELPRRQDGRVVLAWASWLLVLGVSGWLLLAPVKGWAVHHEANFWAPIVEELTAAVVVESLTILILAMVPLSFLEGERLWRAQKLTWALIYGTALFAFLHVVVHPEFGARKTELPLYTWLGFFVGFCLLSVSFWGYFRFRHHEHHPATP
ncbi:MAG: hypothetical protein QOJ03_2996 [Frankiaceae bacterium]|nr:hypothetical protein [Frankiaceae bacterium]